MSDYDGKCRGCFHPDPDISGFMHSSVVTSMVKLVERSSQGCLTCHVLSEAITHFFVDRGQGVPEALSSERSLRIDYNVSATTERSLEITILQNDVERELGPPTKLSFYCSEGESY
jgi:hypothetical protein